MTQSVRPAAKGSQLAPPSRLRATPAVLPTYSVLGSAGSNTMLLTSAAVGSGTPNEGTTPSGASVAPPSIDFSRPGPTPQTVDGACGSTTSRVTDEKELPVRSHDAAPSVDRKIPAGPATYTVDGADRATAMARSCRAFAADPLKPLLTAVHVRAPSVVLKTPAPEVAAYTVNGLAGSMAIPRTSAAGASAVPVHVAPPSALHHTPRSVAAYTRAVSSVNAN